MSNFTVQPAPVSEKTVNDVIDSMQEELFHEKDFRF